MTEAPKHDTVLDSGAERLGSIYARALVSAAKKEGAADQVVQELGWIVDDYLSVSEPLRVVFASPRVKASEKGRVIERLFGESFHPSLVKFLKVMAERDRLGYVAAVRIAAETIHDEMIGRVVASVRTAVPLDDAMRQHVIEKLSSTLGRTVRLEERVDASLIGGMVVRVGDTVFDGSVANRFEQMSRQTREGFSSQLLQRFDAFLSEQS